MVALDANGRVDLAVAAQDDRWRVLICLHVSLLGWKHSNVESLAQVLDSLVDAAHRVALGDFEVGGALQAGVPIRRARGGFHTQTALVLVD